MGNQDHTQTNLHSNSPSNHTGRGNPQNTVIQVTKYFNGVDFPATKEDLIRCAQHNNAPDDVLSTLRKLPEDRFEGVTDVTHAAGHQH